ncbi:hypothetical protein OJAV_G00196990 [Oryzias javanicus]|uniref:Uncharacterized protein n=1 Tax=Oryzias javanicus TaxID=123683 RepID=A0A3S2MG80_ORYJA|nr:hypothetical protein OJAV_G00196990 [Oryzias javanicus]
MEFCDFRELTQTPLDKGSESLSSAVWQQASLMLRIGGMSFCSNWIHIRTFSFPLPDWLPLPNSSIAKHPTCVVQWGEFAHTEGAGCGLGGRCHTKDGFR